MEPNRITAGNRQLQRRRLAGLSTGLSCSPEPAFLSPRAALWIALAALATGLVLGLTADAWAALPARSTPTTTLSPQTP